MGAWKKAIQLLKDTYVLYMRKLTVIYYREMLNEYKQYCDEQVTDARRQRYRAVKERRELQTTIWRLVKWCNRDEYASSVCLGSVNKMTPMGEFEASYQITLVRNTNEFKFIRDMLEWGEKGHPTSTRGVHPAKKWGIKHWETYDE